jgi:hypothetical protein
MLDAATAAQRWQSAASTAQTRFTEGVQNTQKDPTALAAAQAQKMLNGVQQAITSGRWQRRLSEVGQAGWKSATLAKANNYSTGIQASGSKYQQGYGAFAAYMQPYQNQIAGMPKNSLADSIARATAWIQNAANYRAQG